MNNQRPTSGGAVARKRRRRPGVLWRYVLALAREFRGTLAALAAAVLVGGLLYWVTPLDAFHGRPPCRARGTASSGDPRVASPSATMEAP